MKYIILVLIIVAILFSGCQSIPESDRGDGKLSDLEAGYIIMAVADVFIIGGTLWAMSTIPEPYPRDNPLDPEYEE